MPFRSMKMSISFGFLNTPRPENILVTHRHQSTQNQTTLAIKEAHFGIGNAYNILIQLMSLSRWKGLAPAGYEAREG